jgi:hypothetical protein
VSARERAAHARLVAAYRQALGLTAIAVIASADGIGIAAGETAEDNKIATKESLQARWWCRRLSDADALAAAANLRLRRHAPETAAAAVAAAGDAIARAARRRAIDLHTDQEIAAHATNAIARIDAELEQLRRSGELRTVNKSYQSYRCETAARGERVVPYAQWMLAYKENLVRQLAATLRFL